MDSEVLYSIFGVLGLSFVAYMTLRAGPKQSTAKSKEERYLETVNKYKVTLQKSLEDYDKDDEARKAKKIMILREYSEELHFNIFFDEDEAKKIIGELSGE